MFSLNIQKAKLNFSEKEPVITSGAVNAFEVKFTFSSEWDGLTKFATFRTKSSPDDAKHILLGEDDTCPIPWELLTKPGEDIFVGAFGMSSNPAEDPDAKVILPTLWIKIDSVSEGTYTGEEPYPPSPNIYDQFLEMKTGPKGDPGSQGEQGSCPFQTIQSGDWYCRLWEDGYIEMIFSQSGETILSPNNWGVYGNSGLIRYTDDISGGYTYPISLKKLLSFQATFMSSYSDIISETFWVAYISNARIDKLTQVPKLTIVSSGSASANRRIKKYYVVKGLWK